MKATEAKFLDFLLFHSLLGLFCRPLFGLPSRRFRETPSVSREEHAEARARRELLGNREPQAPPARCGEASLAAAGSQAAPEGAGRFLEPGSSRQARSNH